MNFEVFVELKPEVLDVQGRAICNTTKQLGFDAIKSVKVSKRFVIEVDDQVPSAQEVVRKVASEFLANSVSETFQIREL